MVNFIITNMKIRFYYIVTKRIFLTTCVFPLIKSCDKIVFIITENHQHCLRHFQTNPLYVFNNCELVWKMY